MMDNPVDDLDAALRYGRLDAVALVPDTGLVVLTVWTASGVKHLAVGVGPWVAGVGWAPRTPAFVAPRTHPLVAALRAHGVGRTVRGVSLDEAEALWVTLGDAEVMARLRFVPAVRGEVQLSDATGQRFASWRGAAPGPAARVLEGERVEVGAELLRLSDALAVSLRRRAIVKSLEHRQRQLARRQAAVEGDLARLDDVARMQRMGRMLLAQGDRIARGATRAALEDWEEGGTLEVALDPALPAKAQAAGIFARAKRIAQAEAVMWARLEATAKAHAEVTALVEAVRDAEAVTAATLGQWTAAATALGARVEAPGATRRGGAHGGRDRGRVEAARVPYLEYRGAGGARILVGRGAADNDRLTLQVARPQDVWLHARGVPGAHVVVPLVKGASVTPEVLVDAATLAAHHSDARGESVVDVQWTERRYVRKPRKSAAGAVTVDRERVMSLRVEPARLRRLLADKPEGG